MGYCSYQPPTRIISLVTPVVLGFVALARFLNDFYYHPCVSKGAVPFRNIWRFGDVNDSLFDLSFCFWDLGLEDFSCFGRVGLVFFYIATMLSALFPRLRLQYDFMVSSSLRFGR
ncbi:hypothetical protein ACLOJK_040115 [Asimina triloba]